MKVVGLITEYNPFHNGHKFHIDEAKRITKADYVVVVMSGNFVQRGTPALIDKYSRAKMALMHGADLVFELPTVYATASAEYFAYGSVSLLNELSIIDFLCFGSEIGDIKNLNKIADFINKEEVTSLTMSLLKDGLSFPVAREKALNKLINTNEGKLLKSPNNILSIEYIKALNKLKSKISPITIKRKDADYHDDNVYSNISSASAIRKIIENNNSLDDFLQIKDTLPKTSYDILTSKYKASYPITLNDFQSIIKYKLLESRQEDLEKYMDVSNDLANRIKKKINLNQDINSLIKEIKTKNITHTRINRCLIHILLNIYKDDFAAYIKNTPNTYAKVLGVKKTASNLLKAISNNSSINIISNLKKHNNTLSNEGIKMLNTDIFASHLYNQVVYNKYKFNLLSEYKQNPIII